MRFVEADIIVSKNSSLPYIIRLLIKIKMEFHGRIIWAEKFGAGDATNFQATQAQSLFLFEVPRLVAFWIKVAATEDFRQKRRLIGTNVSSVGWKIQ